MSFLRAVYTISDDVITPSVNCLCSLLQCCRDCVVHAVTADSTNPFFILSAYMYVGPILSADICDVTVKP